MRSNRIYLATAVCGIVLAAASPIRAAEDKKPPAPLGIFSLYVENDVAAGTDRNYTNGVKLLWVSPEIGEGERKLRARAGSTSWPAGCRLPRDRGPGGSFPFRWTSPYIRPRTSPAPFRMPLTGHTPDISTPAWPSIAKTRAVWTQPRSTSASSARCPWPGRSKRCGITPSAGIGREAGPISSRTSPYWP